MEVLAGGGTCEATVLPHVRRVPKSYIRWYLVACPVGSESETCERVRRIVYTDILRDMFVPRAERVKKYGGTLVRIVRKLFPGYFVAVISDPFALKVPSWNSASSSVRSATKANGRFRAPYQEWDEYG